MKASKKAGRAIVLTAFLTFCAGAAGAADKPAFNPDGYTSASICSQCHKDIHDMWKNSLHAQAFSNPIFEMASLRAYRSSKGASEKFCTRCHAPAAAAEGDYEGKKSLTREGVTCDFCHSVEKVDLKKMDFPYVVSAGAVKFGPLEDGMPTVHKAEKRDHFAKSEFCAGCHELSSKSGDLIMGTYTEWRKSPYAEQGKQCQDCHMPRVPGKKVTVTGGKENRAVNLHNLQGGASKSQLEKAARLKILSVKRPGDKAVVQVEVANVGSGHYLPTGIPSRKLTLRVSLKTPGGQTLTKQEKEFKKEIVNAAGAKLKNDYEFFLYGEKVVNDNRIAPKEERVETFAFDVPARTKFSVEATLSYGYQPEVFKDQKMEVEFQKAEFSGTKK